MKQGKEGLRRRAKIVCTLGPSTTDDETIQKLILGGMDVARLNFSHGSHDDHAAMIDRVNLMEAAATCWSASVSR